MRVLPFLFMRVGGCESAVVTVAAAAVGGGLEVEVYDSCLRSWKALRQIGPAMRHPLTILSLMFWRAGCSSTETPTGRRETMRGGKPILGRWATTRQRRTMTPDSSPINQDN